MGPPKIEDKLSVKAGTSELGKGWYLVMSNSGNALYPAPYYLPWKTVRIVLNGEAKIFSPQPVIKEGTTLLPFRGLFESLGARVQYNSTDKSVTGSREGAYVSLKLGSRTATVNGKTVYLRQAPEIISGSFYVPARVVAENLGGLVIWDRDAKEIRIDI